ncbi:hypothetical protein BV283P1_00051 [Phocaeicola phage BV283P1]|nr:hypothetical protein BV283P1_00004 [Phocaeicola phage BV283P1]WAX10551.1 hypothetical protein BV283P1_00051 [Phocaeicola phage BV283P1]
MEKNLDLTKTQSLTDCQFVIEEFKLKFQAMGNVYVDTFFRVYYQGSFAHYLYKGMELGTLEEVSNEIYKRS